jgi:hypothetical protein
MNSLERLLATPNSELARLMRFHARGTRAALEAALAEASGDPGASAAREALRELDRLIASGGGGAVPSRGGPAGLSKRADTLPFGVPAASSSTPQASGESFQKLRQDFEKDERLREELGQLKLRATSDGELWGEIQRHLLRVSRSLAKQWKERAAQAAREAGATLDESPRAARIFPSEREETIYPGLAGSVQAAGWRFSASAPLDPVVQGVVGATPLEGDLRLMAKAVSVCVALPREDAGLHHALRTLQRFRVTPLDHEARDAYERELLARLRRLLVARADPIAALRAWVDLDEAIHSLVYLPPAERDSWRGRWLRDVRRALERAADAARAAGANVHLRSLWGPYSEVCDATDSDLELDAGGKPGRVLACLRVYSRINGQASEGRVLYRSLR